jgi:hypothetical protein
MDMPLMSALLLLHLAAHQYISAEIYPLLLKSLGNFKVLGNLCCTCSHRVSDLNQEVK